MTAATLTSAPVSWSRIAGRGFALLVAAVVLAILLQPWWLGSLIAHRLSGSAQREVHFDSMWVSLTGSLQPAVHFRGVRIDNAPWADRNRPFAALGAATAVFSWSSLREQRPVIALMILRDGEVDLERRADGLRNWRLSRPDDRGPGRFKVLSIRGENAAVRFVHERLELELEARASANRDAAAGASGRDPMPTRLVVQGQWRGVPFVIDAATSEVLTFVETGRVFRARGQASSGAARLDFDGHLGDIVRDPRVDARLGLTAPSLAPFAALLGPHRPEAKAIAVTGELKGEPGRYALSVAKAHFGATDLAGELSWTRGDERDLVRVKLTSESASLADLRALAGSRPAKGIERVAIAVTAPARATPASAPASADGAPPEPARVRPVDTELSFAARRLQGEGMPWLQSGRVDAALAGGHLTVSNFDFGIGAGHAVGKASIDTASRPPRGEVEVDVNGLRIESFVPARAAKSLLSGTLHGRAVLKASGESAEALLASIAGTASAFVSEGTISSLLDAKVGLQGGRVVRSMLVGIEPIALRCGAVVLDLERGAAKIRSLVVDTERTRTLGSGTIDLGKERVDVVLTPEAKQAGLFILDRSIHVHGPLREPHHELVARVVPVSAPVRACRAERP